MLRSHLRSFALASLCATACTKATAPPPSAAIMPEPEAELVARSRPPAPAAARPQAQDWAEALAALDRRIDGAKLATTAQPRSFIAADVVASHYLARARLSGDYADYRHAEDWIARAFAIDPDGSFGPFATRAQLAYTLHRLDRVDADFARAQQGRHDDVAISGHRKFAANLALQRGQYDDATRLIDASLALHEGVSNLSSKAYLVLGLGDPVQADALYRRALDEYHGVSREPAAWLHLQLGLADLGRGRYDEALAHYRDAEAELPGYWLVDEHIAEILTLVGQTDAAKAMYLDIIERTHNPEFMDAVAGILAAQGKPGEAKEYVAKAWTRYGALMAAYPEAAYGHALEHVLEFGEDTAFAVDLAEKNHALRPNADAKVLLAQAYLKAERLADARRTIEAALATPWRTADLHAVASTTYAASGDPAKSAEQRALAAAINPRLE